MATPIIEMHGTWQEITTQAPDFGQRPLNVVVYAESEEQANEPHPWTRVLERLEELHANMNPKPDTENFLQLARAGEMWNLDPELD